MTKKLLLFPLLGISFLLGACTAGKSVVINAPIEKVWEYASDSTKAKDWSIYFDHISPMPQLSNGIPDGQVGSVRRCFRRADETGMYWDEDVVEVRPPFYRQIKTYNTHGHHEAKLNEIEYKVEQLYEKIDDQHTRLTFQAQVSKGMDLKAMYYMLRDFQEGTRILQFNLENIKARIESDTRPHPYETTLKWD